VPKRIAIVSVLLLAAVAAGWLWADRFAARAPARSAPVGEGAALPETSPSADRPAAPDAQAAGKLFGRVLEEGTDIPLAGAAVTAYAFATRETMRGMSAEDGTFGFPGAAAGQAFQIVVRHEGSGTASLRVVLSGQRYAPVAEFASQASIAARDQVNRQPRNSPLTRRQRDIIRLLAEGKQNRDIAKALGVAEGTVKVHVANIFRALKVNNRTAAAAAAACAHGDPVARRHGGRTGSASAHAGGRSATRRRRGAAPRHGADPRPASRGHFPGRSGRSWPRSSSSRRWAWVRPSSTRSLTSATASCC